MKAQTLYSITEPVTQAQDNRLPLIGMSFDELTQTFTTMGEQAFRAKQLWHWLYNQGVTDFSEISNMSKQLKTTLAEKFQINRLTASQDLLSEDGTCKWLFTLPDGEEIETVYIPEPDRGTLCISSQVGCTLTCKFCHTGTQTLVRNLTPGEIVGQVMAARDALEDWPSTKHDRKITTIVLMGMGEPLYNYDNVRAALKIIMDETGIAFSKRRITLSTSGVADKIRQCGQELGVNLAISLHAVTNALRSQIIPLNKKYPIEEVLSACKDYYTDRCNRRITFEYVMLKGVNDSMEDAKQLAKLMRGIHAKVNLIPFNPWPGSIYECPSIEHIKTFSNMVKKHGYVAPIRTPRGMDILAACGQLKSASIRKKKKTQASALPEMQ